MSKYLNIDAKKLYYAIQLLRKYDVPITEFISKTHLTENEINFLIDTVKFVEYSGGLIPVEPHTHYAITDLGVISLLGTLGNFVTLIQKTFLELHVINKHN